MAKNNMENKMNNKNSAIAPNEQLHLKTTEKPFSAQGYTDNCYFFYIKNISRVINIKTNQFRQQHLLKLANINYWREHFPTTDKRFKSGVDWNNVELQLMSDCYKVGEFQGTRAKQFPTSTLKMES